MTSTCKVGWRISAVRGFVSQRSGAKRIFAKRMAASTIEMWDLSLMGDEMVTFEKFGNCIVMMLEALLNF